MLFLSFNVTETLILMHTSQFTTFVNNSLLVLCLLKAWIKVNSCKTVTILPTAETWYRISVKTNTNKVLAGAVNTWILVLFCVVMYIVYFQFCSFCMNYVDCQSNGSHSVSVGMSIDLNATWSPVVFCVCWRGSEGVLFCWLFFIFFDHCSIILSRLSWHYLIFLSLIWFC